MDKCLSCAYGTSLKSLYLKRHHHFEIDSNTLFTLHCITFRYTWVGTWEKKILIPIKSFCELSIEMGPHRRKIFFMIIKCDNGIEDYGRLAGGLSRVEDRSQPWDLLKRLHILTYLQFGHADTLTCKVQSFPPWDKWSVNSWLVSQLWNPVDKGLWCWLASTIYKSTGRQIYLQTYMILALG